MQAGHDIQDLGGCFERVPRSIMIGSKEARGGNRISQKSHHLRPVVDLVPEWPIALQLAAVSGNYGAELLPKS